MRSLRSYLPKPGQKEPDKEMVIVNARVPMQMRDSLRRLAERNGWSPSEVIRGSLQKFIDDERAKEAS